jgi:phosphoglycolate phosphatase
MPRVRQGTATGWYDVRVTFRALVSDLDGTLLDTLGDIADSVNASLAIMGLPQHEVDAYRYFVGNGRKIMAMRTLPEDRRDDATLELLLKHIGEEYSRRWMDTSHPFAGIAEMLDALTARGIPLAVLSNKPQVYTEPMVSKLLSRWSFGSVLGESETTPKKPDPTGALRIIRTLNVRPAECLYIGDSGVDMQTAVAAHMYPVGVLWGYRTAEELLTNGAVTLASQPDDVVRLFGD